MPFVLLTSIVLTSQVSEEGGNVLGLETESPHSRPQSQRGAGTGEYLGSPGQRSLPSSPSAEIRSRTSRAPMELDYVTERVLSVFFPKEISDELYIRKLEELSHMLQGKYGDNFKVFNLSERSQELEQFFGENLEELGWPDELAPPLGRLCSICKALETWVASSTSPTRVAVLHSRGWRDRAGVVLSAYLHYSTLCPRNGEHSLDRFAMRRYFDAKIQQLDQPSQKRYIEYFSGLLSGSIRINSSPLYLNRVVVVGCPAFSSRGGSTPFLKVYQGLGPVFISSPVTGVTGDTKSFSIPCGNLRLHGDVLVKCYHLREDGQGRDVIFRCQFHTCAIDSSLLVLKRHELDHACYDMRFPLDGWVELHFGSESSDARQYHHHREGMQETDNAIMKWDSYENCDTRSSPVRSSPYVQTSKTTNPQQEPGVLHTQGPIDGSLYATVNKKKLSPNDLIIEGEEGHTVSMDSGISSSSGPKDGHLSGSSASPPHTAESFLSTVQSDLQFPEVSERSFHTLKTTVEVHPVPRDGRPGPGDPAELDELLQGMLETVENIPDLKPGQGRDVDINSIRTDFDFEHSKSPLAWNGVTSHRSLSVSSGYPPSLGPAPPSSPPITNGYASSVSKASDSCLDDTLNTTVDGLDDCDTPYHTRGDSKPFSYGPVTSSPSFQRRAAQNRSLSSSNTVMMKKEALEPGLESPRLVRKLSAPQSPVNSYSVLESPGFVSRSASFRDRDRESSKTWSSGTGSPYEYKKPLQSSLSFRGTPTYHRDFTYGPEVFSRPSSPGGSTWLQSQQTKLRERQEARLRMARSPHEERLMSELKSVQNKRMLDTGMVQDLSTPLHVHTSSSSSSSPGAHPGSVPENGGSSTYGSPLLSTPTRSSSRQRTAHYQLQRNKSDTSFDRDRPFVSVKRAHEESKRYIEDLEEGGSRPVTPGFPVQNSPRTPYVNSSHSETAAGLPPKSPTSSRKDRSPSPAQGKSQQGQGLLTQAETLNGHVSPSLYHGQSTRSSLLSLTDSPHHDVISHHPVFVSDNSRFWYKPSISREEAIGMLKDKSPGTFVVRDSYSYPGAYGLALKVAAPPVNMSPSKINSGDISNELVRHFLIETTSKGVRIKGCPNEPVFGSLSALVYQHSLTPLALPCKLLLPSSDPACVTSQAVQIESPAQLLVQGAACNVLYLFTVDTESLTGPQAIRKCMGILMAQKTTPTATVVHFKASSQGITLTDNERKVFFSRCFGFVARKPGSRSSNQCHLFAEYEPQQPATAIVNFVTKVMLTDSPLVQFDCTGYGDFVAKVSRISVTPTFIFEFEAGSD
ncbi:unnamed protein product [Darwinula stevensoni]|uniref:Tensin n=1 Tax=Darwinula stevensoni TaxID=69355 RepID=A0A7R9A1V1_9CRUS|nr:unnamed protein product [Darwinula stevensoni]CAG0888462.1 unnamed protein product [Darwinula stevensoni]